MQIILYKSLAAPHKGKGNCFSLQLIAHHYSKKAWDCSEGNAVPLILCLIVLVHSLFRLLSETQFYYFKYYYTSSLLVFYNIIFVLMMGVIMYQFEEILEEHHAQVFSLHSGQLLFCFLVRCHFFQSQGCIFASADNECKINSQGRHLLRSLALAHGIGKQTL